MRRRRARRRPGHISARLRRPSNHRPVAGDSPAAEAVKLLARTHQSLIWDRTRQVLRLRSALREFFPAALEAFDDLTAADTLELLARAPDPDRAASDAGDAHVLAEIVRLDPEHSRGKLEGSLVQP